jgi:hypothetical protein
MRFAPFFPEVDRATLAERVLEVLHAIKFFEKTRFKQFLLAIQAHHAPYPVGQTLVASI